MGLAYNTYAQKITYQIIIGIILFVSLISCHNDVDRTCIILEDLYAINPSDYPNKCTNLIQIQNGQYKKFIVTSCIIDMKSYKNKIYVKCGSKEFYEYIKIYKKPNTSDWQTYTINIDEYNDIANKGETLTYKCN